MKRIALASVALVVVFAVWTALFVKFGSTERTLFPGNTYQVYAVSDATVGGFSTVELSHNDSLVSARVNIRSGMAYPYAGVGINLLSVDNRPASGYFDFSDFDSLVIDVETGRMKRVGVKILNDDPVYSKKNVYQSYRPMVAQAPVQIRGKKSGVAISMLDFKVPEWWLAQQGLDEDDGLRYMNRGMLFEITNGEGTMLGIPDEIDVRSIRLWGENRTFKALMFVALAVIVLAYAGFISLTVRNSKGQVESREKKYNELKSRMGQAAKLLKESDRSIAEIAIAVGEKSSGAFEKDFVRVYGVKPLEYRTKK
ncbi:AraC family transcriptional regulator [uncultured Fibrobacter sp.]|uniref:helix-turn-helix domain-containing protein n=1 Tax=uncultured Fibrobacter sp. TaxID=261512 RepID=UPI00261A2440|nr:helix-turn-helix domain-containing protein [uncultured Fibrobacter sp.]